MKIEIREGKPMMIQEIKEGDVFILENGNWMVVNMILSDGTYKSTIIDPEEMRHYSCYGDFKNLSQNDNIVCRMEEG